MSVLDSMVSSIEDIAKFLAKNFTSTNLSEYCSLDTSMGLSSEDKQKNPDLISSYIIVNDNRSLITVYDIQGTHQILSDTEYENLVHSLRIKLNGYLNRNGNEISFCFERDPYRSKRTLMKLIEPQIKTAERIGLNTKDIIIDRAMRNLPYVSYEKNLLVVFTHMSIFTREEAKREIKDKYTEIIKNDVPQYSYSQDPLKIINSLKFRHDTILERLEEDFKHCGNSSSGIMLQRLSASEALSILGGMINRETMTDSFRPCLLGESRLLPVGNEDKNDYSNYLPPKIKYQLCNGFIELKEREIIKTSSLYHANLSISILPMELKSFEDLFNNIDKTAPWRVKFDIEPNGLDYFKARRLALSFVSMMPYNKQIKQAFDNLVEISKNQCICSLKITFSTWADTDKLAQQRLDMISKAVQAWGICHINNTTGDALASWVATLPAFSSKNISTRLISPLEEALYMLPFQRPATPWSTNGNLILRTPDGKVFPVELGSSLQDTWIEIISAPPGSGKSVFMNTMNSAFIHSAGNSKIPLMTIIDVGPSSSGLISLVQDSLPDDRKHEALYIRLQNDSSFAVNPWDTQLGCRYPTVREKEFLVDFMTLLCTTPSTGTAPEGVAHVCEQILNIAYKEKDSINPNIYEKGISREVDEAINDVLLDSSKYTSEWWTEATWFEVTDLLFLAGKIRESAIAQRYAVPILSDFAAYLQHPTVVQIYGDAKTLTGESLLSYVNRSLISASTNYALFNGITKYELSSETRLISIDLNDVIGQQTPEGKLRTTIMYLFARQLAAKNYFLKEENIIPVSPAIYHSYHRQRVANIENEKKVIAYDETHNSNGMEIFSSTMIKDGREGRKWGIRIINSSQFLSDHSTKLLDSATCIFVMKGGNNSDNLILKEMWQISDDIIQKLQQQAIGPTSSGGTLLAIFKTKVGQIVQLLTNTVGPIELWAFSTTLEDVALRNGLYKRIGSYNARKILATEFPSGSAIKHIEKLRVELGSANSDSVLNIIIENLVNKFNESEKVGHYEK